MSGAVDAPDVAAAGSEGHGSRLGLSAWAWSLYQAARDPYIILIGTYVFVPYFATAVVGDAVRGQSVVAGFSLVSNLFVALTAPFLGAAVDQMGARKPWMLALTLMTAPLIMGLWLLTPAGTPGLGVMAGVVMLTLIAILLSYADVFYNAMLMSAARPSEQPAASGLAFSLGNATAIVMLVAVLALFVLPGQPGWSILPLQPLFGLDAALREPERITGPIVGLFLLLGAVPLFLFARDVKPTGAPLLKAFSDGARHLTGLVRSARVPRDVGVYLLARMFYIDGKMALLVFGGVYAAGVMGWGVTELLALGLIACVAGVLGGVFGGWLDNLLGPRGAFKLEIWVTILALIAQITTSPSRLLFFFPADDLRLWDGLFGSAPEVVYLLAVIVVSVFGTASWASSRTLMTRLTPPQEAGTFFGLFALSQTATMWLGPLLVDAFTRTFHSQQAGFAPIVILMVVGLVLLHFVRGGGRLTRALPASPI
ncbi:MAG: MFS transporter [Candidatus Brevundimonas colombiensis]|uniref:MFS transporter n=1 Tax=Candidatus Brevundimonas colombiensis TaxID=3121376 RepID=A0AAJ6BKP4_9CAUL|nr:MFS transporter [Brevundimonas sp.]WEK40683.1 MAG: MFS transporter [Brevundimonas sp.]